MLEQAEHEARFQGFVRARWSRLVRTAYLLTGDAHHAEDLTQTADGLESCLAFQRSGRTRGGTDPGAPGDYRILAAMRSTGDSNTPGDGMYVSPRVRRRSGSVTVPYGDCRRTLP